MIGEWISDETMFAIWFLTGLICLIMEIGGASALMLVISASAFLTAYAMKSYSLHVTFQFILFISLFYLGLKIRMLLRARKRVKTATPKPISRQNVIEHDEFVVASHKKAA
jgi:membrane protein implicated in regulation of membrane protease activity